VKPVMVEEGCGGGSHGNGLVSPLARECEAIAEALGGLQLSASGRIEL